MKDSHDIDRSYIFIYPINHKLCHARYFCLPVFLFSKHIIDTCWKLPWIFFQTIINFFDSRKKMFGCLIAFQRIQQISQQLILMFRCLLRNFQFITHISPSWMQAAISHSSSAPLLSGSPTPPAPYKLLTTSSSVHSFPYS